MNHKRLNGQFFTKNSEYILQGFSRFVVGKEIVDPFAGDQDLICWAVNHAAKKVIGFDVDQTYVDDKIVFKNNSINYVKKYKFVLTNPPYLHKNKATKEVKEKYFTGSNSQFEDLYQVSIHAILNSDEGILIVPLNFLSAKNSEKIRRIFFNKFEIVSLNIFWEQVFDDTTYNVISFFYRKKKKPSRKNVIDATIFPARKKVKLVLNEEYGWQLGGEFFSKINSIKNFLGIYRLTEKDLLAGEKKVKLAHNNIKNHKTYSVNKHIDNILDHNIIFLRAIDSKNGKKIQLEDIRDYSVKGLVGKETSRNMAHLLFKETIDLETQKQLIDFFNKKLSSAREKYFSLFLTNFRDNNRKRISFNFTYKLLNYIYLEELAQQKTLII